MTPDEDLGRRRGDSDPGAVAVERSTFDRVVATWRERLADAPPVADITGDHPRPFALGPERSTSTINIVDSPVDLDSIDPGTFPLTDDLIAAWMLLVARSSGETALVVAELEREPDRGTLLEVDVSAFSTFDDLRTWVAETRARLRERGTVSFVELSRALGLTRTDRHPLCATSVGPSNGSSRSPSQLPAPDVDLTWTRTVDGRVDVCIGGASELFRSERIDRLADQFSRLLRSARARPGVPLDELDWVSDDDVAQMRSWQGQRTTPDDTQLGRRFSQSAVLHPDRPAVEFAGEVWTYARLDAWSNRLAHAIRARGIGTNDLIAVRVARSIELVASILAVLKSGAAYVPVDPDYPLQRQAFMLADSGATLLLTGSSESAIADHEVPSIIVDDPRASFHSDSSEPVDAIGDGSEGGYAIYTSGSTGVPKAVTLPIRALANLLDWQLAQPDFEPGLRTLQYSSASFDVSFQEIMATLLSGGTLVVVDDVVRRDPRGLLRHLVEFGVERIFLPNVALRSLADAATGSTSPPLALREVYTAGEQLRVDAVLRSFFASLPQCRLTNQYGPSETHVVTSHRLGPRPRDWPNLPPIGRPIANVRCEVLDGAGHRTPVGVPGELWLGGLCLADGYLNRPEETAARFVADPFRIGERLYRTGDHARWTEEGELEFLGRRDQQVKFRGFRIETGEIAVVLSSRPGVEQCFVDVRDVPGAGQRLVAYVRFSSGDGSMAALRAHAADHLPDFMVPTHYVDVAELPLTASGKVDVQALPAPTFDRRSLDTAYVAPSSDVDDALQEMWQAVLGIDVIGIDDDFFDLGGDSLVAVELFTMMADRFGVELPLGALAANPTIAGLSAHVQRVREGADSFEVVVPVRTTGDRTAVFFVHGGSGNVASLPRLVRALEDDRPVYGLQWPGIATTSSPRSISALAATYIDEMTAVRPSGPYVLAGQCIGGLIAHEMAAQLTESGEQVALVVMYDSPMLYSPDFRPSGAVPPIPTPLRPLVTRALSALVSIVRFVKGAENRRQVARVRWQAATRSPIARQDRFLHAAIALAALSWRHRPPDVGVPTALIHSGEANAAMLGFTGRWTDGALGWRHRVGKRFSAHRVRGSHNELLYGDDAVAVMRELLATHG